MKGNVTSGILLLLGAALLITIGISGKGKDVLNILFNDNPSTTHESSSGRIHGGSSGTFDSRFDGVSGSPVDYNRTPGADVGMKGAKIL